MDVGLADHPNDWTGSNHIRNFRVYPSEVGARVLPPKTEALQIGKERQLFCFSKTALTI
jgi:hypothetical protein